MNKINIDKNAKYIIDVLQKNGFNAFVVGGCVRDIIMGVPPKDFDIATSATPLEVKELFEKCIDTGIAHGTVTIVLDKEMYEVTTFRIDGEYLDNRKPSNVVYTNDVYEDMLRRDFTINAIGYNDKDGFIDYFDGFKDIENKVIRGVGDPKVRFTEDALRMLRAIRFSSTLNFDIEENTYNAIKEKNYLLQNISVERIREEFTKTLLSNNNEKIEMLIDTELFKYYNEELFNYIKNSLFDITEFLKYSKKDKTYLYVALFHKFGYENTKNHLKLLKWDNKTIKDVSDIVGQFDNELIENGHYIRTIAAKIGIENTFVYLFYLEKINNKSYSHLFEELELITKNNYPISIKDMLISGDDLKEIGITNGKTIGNCLKYIFEKVLENPNLNNTDTLLKMAGEFSESKIV